MIHRITQNDDYSLDYEIHYANGDVRHLSNDQVLHLRGLVLNGFLGINPIEYREDRQRFGFRDVPRALGRSWYAPERGDQASSRPLRPCARQPSSQLESEI